MANSIVEVDVSVTAAPTPASLQRTGALISQGATTATVGDYKLLTQYSDLASLLIAPLDLQSLTWSGGTVTATAVANLAANVSTGDTFPVTISGASPAGYNGTFLATVTGADTFTYALSANPGTETAPGTYTAPGVVELQQMAQTFFAQGAQMSVYVLELGAGDAASGVTQLTSFITANPSTIYAYLIPRSWDSEPTFLSFLSGYTGVTAMTYFFVTTTVASYTQYSSTEKCVVALVESPDAPLTEFSCAAALWSALHYDPSSTNKVTPFAFSFLSGVTAYPVKGNSATLAALKGAYVNYVAVASEGGLTNTMLAWGTTLDGRDFTYWYSVDWAQINLGRAIANAVINGSNNALNPLYFNQDGINRLQDVVAATLQSAVTYGLSIGTVVRSSLSGPAFTQALDAGTYDGDDVVNAVPFADYVAANPGDYKIGKYAGLSAVYIPARGFLQIVFTLNVTDFLSQ